MSEELITHENSLDHLNSLVVADSILPDVLSLFPLKERPLFPGIMHPVILTKEEHIQFALEILKSNSPYVGLCLLQENDELAPIGVVAKIIQANQTQSGHLHILLSTIERFQVIEYIKKDPPFKAKVQYWHDERPVLSDELKAYSVSIINTIRELVRLGPLFKEELSMLIGKSGVDDPRKLSSYAAILTTSSREELQELLEIRPLMPRLEKSLELLKRELEIATTQKMINQRVEERLGKQQREFFLRQQLTEIKKELGITKDEKEDIIDHFNQKVKNLKLSPEAKDRFEEELKKLQFLEPSSAEYNVSRNYLDWITNLPWGISTEDQFDLKNAKMVLNQDHWGMKDVKERIIEFIAVGKMKGTVKGTILLLIGPPGVGKTSIAKSIAKALGRQFFRFSLGGMRDEAEIKGHRRTYIGAMPGKFIQAMKNAKASNPVILLDEIDKVGHSYQGDPASALLEVLDPEQNKDFRDHFLDLSFDLSNVLFICTANQADSIPAPLFDRMEVISLSGYITEEKIQIAKRYLIPKTTKDMGLPANWNNAVETDVLRRLIEDYARESGVRMLEKQINKLMRKTVSHYLETENEVPENPPLMTAEDLKEHLGRPRFRQENYFKKSEVGVVTGLAYTSHGGETLNIEARGILGKEGGLKQTGQLGSVMQESVQIAYSYVRGLNTEFFEKNSIHLHVPSGATPKDGPSAGITMASALYSLATGKPIKENLAMTGELTLTGRVLPIGGVKEKLLAAKRAQITELIFPLENKGDYEELDAETKNGINPHFVSTFDEVLQIGFE